MGLLDPPRLEASVRSRVERLATELASGDAEARAAWISRLRRELAYRRLLARLVAGAPGSWFLKGGLALQFRLDPSRASLDVDIGSTDSADAALTERNFREAIALDLGDHFSFEAGLARQSRDDHAITLPVTASIGASKFEQFRVDLAPPRVDTVTDEIPFVFTPLGIPELDEAPQIRVIDLNQQIAEKVCAMFERRNGAFSSRARDLADIAAIATQVEGLRSDTIAALAQAEAGRRPGTLPGGLPRAFALPLDQARDWQRRWDDIVRGVPIGFDEAFTIADDFLAPILSPDPPGLLWSPGERRWLSPVGEKKRYA